MTAFIREAEDGHFAAAAPVCAIHQTLSHQLIDGGADGGGSAGIQTVHELGGGGAAILREEIEDSGGGRELVVAELGGGLLLGVGKPEAFLDALPGGLKVGTGGEGQWEGGAGFERAEMDKGVANLGFDSQHKVYGTGDGGGAAKDAALVGVMDEEHGGVAVLRKTAQVAEGRVDGEDAVLITSADDIHKGIDDDEAHGVGAGLLGKFLRLAGVAQVVGAHADEVEVGAGRRLVGVEGGVQAGEHAGVAGLFIDHEDR